MFNEPNLLAKINIKILNYCALHRNIKYSVNTHVWTFNSKLKIFAQFLERYIHTYIFFSSFCPMSFKLYIKNVYYSCFQLKETEKKKKKNVWSYLTLEHLLLHYIILYKKIFPVFRYGSASSLGVQHHSRHTGIVFTLQL